jgi:hypothetical protein
MKAIQKLILQSKQIYLVYLLKNDKLNESEKVIPDENISFLKKLYI